MSNQKVTLSVLKVFVLERSFDIQAKNLEEARAILQDKFNRGVVDGNNAFDYDVTDVEHHKPDISDLDISEVAEITFTDSEQPSKTLPPNQPGYRAQVRPS